MSCTCQGLARAALASFALTVCATSAGLAAPVRQARSVQAAAGATRVGGYPELISLFREWRAFQRPVVVDGVPDYTAAAMEKQRRALPGLQRRLAAIDPSGWTVAQQVDYHLVRAEMNGLDFDHRVLRPWARNPAFYVTVVADESDQPAREGPLALGTVELWRYRFPLDEASAGRLAAGLAPIPGLLRQARGNLTGKARDLWVRGLHSLQGQRTLLAGLREQVGPHPALKTAVQRALDATDELIAWAAREGGDKTEPSGVGVENYDWYLANVQLVPYTWADEVALVERELARARASLALEEEHNRKLPEQTPIGSAEEYQRRSQQGVTDYMAFLRNHDVLTIRDDMDPALRTHLGAYSPGRPLEFFNEVDYRDPMLMRTHFFHFFDLARMEHDPHQSPVRRGPLLYNIFDTRTEGFATAMEELMLQVGLCDGRPRSRELIYVLLAQRAARALADLHMQANEFTLEQAASFASSHTPRGWLRLRGHTVWGEQHLYLQQPGYGTSYVIGKIEVDKLLSDRARQLGKAFTLRRALDEMQDVGLIPISLLRWQLTGASDEVPGVGWRH